MGGRRKDGEGQEVWRNHEWGRGLEKGVWGCGVRIWAVNGVDDELEGQARCRQSEVGGIKTWRETEKNETLESIMKIARYLGTGHLPCLGTYLP